MWGREFLVERESIELNQSVDLVSERTGDQVNKKEEKV